MKTQNRLEERNFEDNDGFSENRATLIMKNHICRERSSLRAQRNYVSLQLTDFCALLTKAQYARTSGS
ncbi:MAG: hypothetical protein AABX14_05790, partial [Candidatus Aenigmatarchaeota archaeon]